jgi:hypothetical protein
MLKYVITRLMQAFFHIRIVIIPQPISALGLKKTWPISVSRDDNSLDMEKAIGRK